MKKPKGSNNIMNVINFMEVDAAKEMRRYILLNFRIGVLEDIEQYDNNLILLSAITNRIAGMIGLAAYTADNETFINDMVGCIDDYAREQYKILQHRFEISTKIAKRYGKDINSYIDRTTMVKIMKETDEEFEKQQRIGEC